MIRSTAVPLPTQANSNLRPGGVTTRRQLTRVQRTCFITGSLLQAARRRLARQGAAIPKMAIPIPLDGPEDEGETRR
jgi:hypothetical protein